jgi:arylsulfatase A
MSKAPSATGVPTVLVLIGTVLSSAMLSCSSSADAAERPNVIVILADDLGAMDLGCTGSRFHRTPELDQMAQAGVRFTQGYAACPVCSPTRAALMTGKYPPRLQITDWLPGRPDLPEHPLARPFLRQQLPADEVTLAELLKSAGYVTGHIGKWHLGGVGSSPVDHGFEVNIGGDQTGTPLSYFAPFQKQQRTMVGLETAEAGEYLTDRLATEAERFIEQHRDRPFFLYLPHYAVHTPLQAPEATVATYPSATPFRGEQNNPVYAAMLEHLDRAVGRVRRKLHELNLSDRTWVVFTSDNGGLATQEGKLTPATSNAPLREGKGWLYEGGLRVPLLIEGPGVAQRGTTIDTPVITHDLYATVARWCGVTVSHAIDGVDLSPLWTEPDDKTAAAGEALSQRDLFWHYPHYANQHSRPGAVIRRGEWKLVEFYEQNRRELYRLSEDPRENRNISDQHADVVTELAAALEQWRNEVGALRPTPNPAYRPHPPDAQGRIVLPAKTAMVTGQMLRFEPLPHKATLGYWVNPADTAAWEFTVVEPGLFHVTGLIGCGNGSGGSKVQFVVGSQQLELTVPETGGFQAFQPMPLGTLRFTEPGRHRLDVIPISKPGPAVMDLRELVLTPAGT